MHTRGSSRLTSQKRKELILNLCRALCVLNSPEEVAEALTDLLTPKEAETIAKRLHIAELLVKGKDYNFIRSELKVGHSTIARVNTWLNLSGEGYRLMLSRKKSSPPGITDEEKYDPFSWHNLKRRYSLYFWPQLLLQKLIESADSKQRQKIESILEKLQTKQQKFTSQTNKQLFEMFAASFERKSLGKKP